mgnify:CR=1 FL=1|jgi:hypothetical protein|tara:strand:+ start:521 stop:865 length:345 start_codon:yes stop_codon:yes gene_type:complete
MTANSEIILSENTHPGDSSTSTVIGSNFKGDGYYGRSDGVHTVQYDYVGLAGTITIQATLATIPTDSDWFDVHSYSAGSSETAVKYANFTGNFVYIRAKLVYTDGTVNSIRLNH